MLRCSLAFLAVSCTTSAAETAYHPPTAALEVVSVLADADEDGLSDLEELALGSDPALADSDGDGLGDGVESALGTHPNLLDTDHDGFFDGDEVNAYRDPLDASSLIYEGGWPSTPDLGGYAPKGDGC